MKRLKKVWKLLQIDVVSLKELEVEVPVVNPSSEDSTVTPSSADPTVTPLSEDSTVAPSSEDSTVAPSSEDSTVTPSSDDFTVTLFLKAPTVTPSSGDPTVTPSSDDSTVTPISEDPTVDASEDVMETEDDIAASFIATCSVGDNMNIEIETPTREDIIGIPEMANNLLAPPEMESTAENSQRMEEEIAQNLQLQNKMPASLHDLKSTNSYDSMPVIETAASQPLSEKNNASTALIQLEISSEPGVDPSSDLQNIDGSRDTRENDSGLGLGPDTDTTASGRHNSVFYLLLSRTPGASV